MRYSSLIVVPAILLISCLPSATRPNPDDVLKLATAASQNLLSAHVQGELQFRAGEPVFGGIKQGKAEVEGVIQDGGRFLDMVISLASEEQDSVQANISTDMHVIVAGQDNVFLRIDSIAGESSTFVMPAGTGTWWKLPPTGLSATHATLTPDPKFLELQSKSVVVLDDEGYETIHGRRARHYDVAADKKKLAVFMQEVARSRGHELTEAEALLSIQHLTMNGELWIDAETYVLHKVQWSIVSDDASSPLDVRFTLTMRDHNAQVNIQEPNDAQMLPVEFSLIPTL
jgi:hypothetical protein